VWTVQIEVVGALQQACRRAGSNVLGCGNSKVGWDSVLSNVRQPVDHESVQGGEIDAVLNHTVPNAWLDVVRTKKDYMEGKEAGIDYLQINVTQPPMNDVRVRKAFNYAVDKNAWAAWRKIVKPLTAFTPEGIFPGYPQPKVMILIPNEEDSYLARQAIP
jgi:ABC-type transport system substrate-binding protein